MFLLIINNLALAGGINNKGKLWDDNNEPSRFSHILENCISKKNAVADNSISLLNSFVVNNYTYKFEFQKNLNKNSGFEPIIDAVLKNTTNPPITADKTQENHSYSTPENNNNNSFSDSEPGLSEYLAGTSMTISVSSSTICYGSSVNVTWTWNLGDSPQGYAQYSLDNVTWYNMNAGPLATISSGSPKTITPNATTTYYGRVMGNMGVIQLNATPVTVTLTCCSNLDHGGANWTISSNTVLGGSHINVGTFTVNSGVVVTVSPSCNYLYVDAQNIVINGTINANGAGGSGGTGGSYGGLWAQGGYTDGRGITSCWDKDNCRSLGLGGGYRGATGIGTGGGGISYNGSNGTMGYGSKQQCFFIGDEGGMVGGGGGAGAGAGGSYGGLAGSGSSGGQGGSDDDWCGNAGCQSYSEGVGGNGANAYVTYGNTTSQAIEYGSGGAGGGGGGRGSFCYDYDPLTSHTCFTAGGTGGTGGGAVRLIASNNLTVSASGVITANGANGNKGGEGGENDYTEGCCEDLSPDCTEQTYTAPGGGGGGAGGGSGGGIMLKANCNLTMVGTLQANGGQGGQGGDGGWSDWSAAYDGGKGSGGGGGGGGRIKIFTNLCSAPNIGGSVSVTGGTGGAVANYGRSGTGSSGNSGNAGTYNTNTFAIDFTMPANGSSTVPCIANATAPTPPTVYDYCGNIITPTGPSIGGTYNGCEGTRTYTYTYRNCVGGYSHNWVYTYTIERNDFSLPANGSSTVACIANATAPTPPTVNDDCGNAITPSGPVLGGTYVNCEGTRTYTYTYADCEGNSHNWVYTYTIEVLPFPNPPDGSSTVDCIADAVAPTLPVVTDNCGNTLTPTGPTIGGTYVNCEGTRTYTYVYTDCEGNTQDWLYTYTIERQDFSLPANGSSTVACIANA
ncbi:MAG TPA: hypothetical protein PLK75_08045, partial [Bacteroidales bacterium]|nr:hypothetical protein [Bacteroidales bacterium]